jgi:hypothetical protein
MYMKIINFLVSYKMIFVSMDKPGYFIFSERTKAQYTHFKATADPHDQFEITDLVLATISNHNFEQLQMCSIRQCNTS